MTSILAPIPSAVKGCASRRLCYNAGPMEGIMLIVYEGQDEVIVTTDELEKQTLKEWFKDGDRDLEDYDRIEIKDEAVAITATLHV